MAGARFGKGGRAPQAKFYFYNPASEALRRGWWDQDVAEAGWYEKTYPSIEAVGKCMTKGRILFPEPKQPQPKQKEEGEEGEEKEGQEAQNVISWGIWASQELCERSRQDLSELQDTKILGYLLIVGSSIKPIA